MKFYIKTLILFLITFGVFTSCKKAGSELNYGYSKVYMPQAVAQNGTTNNQYAVPAGTDSSTFNYIINTDSNTVKIRLGAAVSGSSRNGFSVDINVNSDTINKLLANGTLDPTKNVLMPASMYTVPSKLTVQKGQVNGAFYLTVDATQLKSSVYAGKNLCVWVNIANPTNYTLDSAATGTLVILNANNIINTFPRLYMPQASSLTILAANLGTAYTMDTINKKLNVILGAALGSVINSSAVLRSNANPYAVNISVNTDTITKLFANGTFSLPKNIAMPASMYTLPSTISVPAGQIAGGAVNLSVDLTQLKSYVGKTLVLAVQISNPTGGGYSLNPGLTTTIISFNVNDIFGLVSPNYVSTWNGMNINGGNVTPKQAGWINPAMDTYSVWNIANGGSGCRFRDYMTGGSWTDGVSKFDDGTAVPSGYRELMLRFDNGNYVHSTFLYPTQALQANTTYTFKFDFVTGGSGTPPQIMNVGICGSSDGTQVLTTVPFTSSNSTTVWSRNKSFIFTTTNAGVYYVFFGNGNSGNVWFGIGNLALNP